MRFSPHFQLFYFNDRLEFCEFFEWKIKRINNADLFSQPTLVIFTKGANISGGHCTFSQLADAFIQSDLQMRTMEAIKINKRAMLHSNMQVL